VHIEKRLRRYSRLRKGRKTTAVKRT
jgi:hypothetical protein